VKVAHFADVQSQWYRNCEGHLQGSHRSDSAFSPPDAAKATAKAPATGNKSRNRWVLHRTALARFNDADTIFYPPNVGGGPSKHAASPVAQGPDGRGAEQCSLQAASGN
jgi:hypothetical protein